MTILLALFGFARSEDQARIPPILAWLLLGGACYGAAWIVEYAARLMPVLSVYFRTVGLVAVAVLAQGFVRFLVYRDNLSWTGWLKERLK